jgi:hypothetical protein
VGEDGGGDAFVDVEGRLGPIAHDGRPTAFARGNVAHVEVTR